MKYKNPDSFEQATSDCGPNKKTIKQQLKSMYEAKEIIWDLVENNYIPYEVQRQVQGDILLKIKYKEKQLRDYKINK